MANMTPTVLKNEGTASNPICVDSPMRVRSRASMGKDEEEEPSNKRLKTVTNENLDNNVVTNNAAKAAPTGHNHEDDDVEAPPFEAVQDDNDDFDVEAFLQAQRDATEFDEQAFDNAFLKAWRIAVSRPPQWTGSGLFDMEAVNEIAALRQKRAQETQVTFDDFGAALALYNHNGGENWVVKPVKGKHKIRCRECGCDFNFKRFYIAGRAVRRETDKKICVGCMGRRIHKHLGTTDPKAIRAELDKVLPEYAAEAEPAQSPPSPHEESKPTTKVASQDSSSAIATDSKAAAGGNWTTTAARNGAVSAGAPVSTTINVLPRQGSFKNRNAPPPMVLPPPALPYSTRSGGSDHNQGSLQPLDIGWNGYSNNQGPEWNGGGWNQGGSWDPQATKQPPCSCNQCQGHPPPFQGPHPPCQGPPPTYQGPPSLHQGPPPPKYPGHPPRYEGVPLEYQGPPPPHQGPLPYFG